MVPKAETPKAGCWARLVWANTETLPWIGPAVKAVPDWPGNGVTASVGFVGDMLRTKGMGKMEGNRESEMKEVNKI
jgi:hypothetical protein